MAAISGEPDLTPAPAPEFATWGHRAGRIAVMGPPHAVATVRMGMVEGGHAVQVNTQIVSAFDLWYPSEPGQRVLWPSTVRLSAEYFASLSRHAVPLDRRAVGALAGSALALDMYTWLAQRLHRIAPSQPQFVAWANLHDQFGQGYARVRTSASGSWRRFARSTPSTRMLGCRPTNAA